MQIDDIESSSNQSVSTQQEYSDFDIAIIGMAGRFPDADSVDEYWENISAGKEAITFFSDDELTQSGVKPEVFTKPNYVKAAPILKNPKRFDAQFFGYSPREAASTDPQHRLFLECAWESLEMAGYNADRINGPVGVFGGAAMNTYLLFSGLLPQFSNDYLPTLIGNDNSFLATRVSYKLNLTGPSITVQTACSSSLVAIHTACQSLLSGECEMALAGGVSVRVPHHAGYLYNEHSVFSPDGHCRTFDENAAGTIFGSGVGVIVLKRLKDAIDDHDTVHAIIKGSAVNNDGSSKVDYTAPSVVSQSQVITEALANADVSAETISYIEAHGTGTNLGDPIEVAALSKAFRNDTSQTQFCAIGSVKPNIGHLDAAAGVAGLIKTVLALQNRQIPASINFEKPNPQIDFENSPFFVNTELREWKAKGFPRRAGISSLGIGGTNAHIVLEEAPLGDGIISENANVLPDTKHQILLVSARTNSALSEYTANLAEYLSRNPHTNLADVSYTLREGRKSFEYRCHTVCATTEVASVQLATLTEKLSATSVQKSDKKKVVFMFPGQGTQYIGMGRELYENEETFRAAVDRCAALLHPELNQNIREIFYPSSKPEGAESLLTETMWAQPAIFVIEYAMAQLLISRGIHPDAVVGHSVGEYAAACIADIFLLEDALRLVAARGRLIQKLPHGDMLAVRLTAEELSPYLNANVSIASINSPGRCVLSGTPEAIADVQQSLTEVGVAHQLLHTSHAFHSPMMEPVLDEFMKYVETVPRHNAQIQFVSTVTGTNLTHGEYLSAAYWCDNLRQSVCFMDAVTNLITDSNPLLVEVGPGTTLSAFVRQNHLFDKQKHSVVSSIRHPQSSTEDAALLLEVMGSAWAAGIEVNWSNLTDRVTLNRLPLPTYPFEQHEHWYVPKVDEQSTGSTNAIFNSTHQAASAFSVPSWRRAEPVAQYYPNDHESTWLIFMSEHKLDTNLIGRLQEQGASAKNIITVSMGEEYKQLDQNTFIIQPTRKDCYEQLFSVLVDEGKIPTQVLYLWSATSETNTSVLSADNLSSYADSFTSVLYLSQHLGRFDRENKIKLGIVTTKLHDVLGIEQLEPAKALLLGPARVINKEHKNIECFLIDILPPLQLEEKDTLAVYDQLIAEMIQPASRGISIAYRGTRRWIQQLEPVNIQNSQTDELLRLDKLRSNGVYLVTGGQTGIGFAIAEFLVNEIDASVILLGRSPVPPRSEWEQWISEHGKDDPASRKISSFLALGEKVENIHLVESDVSNYRQMKLVVEQIEQEHGAINGLIHAAGVIEDSLIAKKEIDSSLRVFEAKVAGTIVLGSLFQDKNLDIFVLCSSINSYLAPAGQVDYVAANSFQDYFAQFGRRNLGLPAISINWPGWRDVGLLARLEDSPWKEAQLRDAITTEAGINIFRSALRSNYPSVFIDHTQLSTGNNEGEHSFLPSLTNKISADALMENTTTKNAGVEEPIDEFAQELEALVCDMWGTVLGVTDLNRLDNFFELGGSSLLATQLLNEIFDRLDITMEIKDIFDAPTVRELSQRIEEQLVADLFAQE